MNITENGNGLLKELEEKRGGKIGKRTFSLWCILPNGKLYEHGMFVYEIDGTVYYEDFEKQSINIFGFNIQKKNKEPFIKTEGTFSKNDVERTIKVSKKAAMKYAKSENKNPAVLKKAGKTVRFFAPCTDAVVLKNGDVYFFELLNNIF